MSICLHLYISGRVQGVCYRASAQMQAVELGLKGFARNLDDGRVEIIVTGKEVVVEQFVNWCQQGPAMAQVSGIKKHSIQCPEQFGNFDVRY